MITRIGEAKSVRLFRRSRNGKSSSFCAGTLFVTFRAGWTATSSNESAQSIQPFIPGKVLGDLDGNPLFLPCRPCRIASWLERNASVDCGATLRLRLD